jgi:hypothetical protein
MAILEIPTNSDNPSWSEIIALEGIGYLLSFTWNNRDNSWVLDIQLPDETPIIMGIKMITNYELLGTYAEQNMPEGSMVLYDTSGAREDCTRDELGNRWKLYYVTSDDPIALAIKEEFGYELI